MSGRAGLHYAFRRLHRGENEMHERLVAVARRQKAEHEVHFTALDIARWSRDHVSQLAQVAAHYDLDLGTTANEPGAVSRVVEHAAAAVGRHPEPGVLLLEDLRGLYVLGSDNSLGWELLAQHAQAVRESDVLELTERCHPQNLRQIRWANTMLKTVSPQILASL